MNTFDSEITVETKSVDEALNKLRQPGEELDNVSLAPDLFRKGAHELCQRSFEPAIMEQITTAKKKMNTENIKEGVGMMENQAPIMEFGNIEQAYKCPDDWSGGNEKRRRRSRRIRRNKFIYIYA